MAIRKLPDVDSVDMDEVFSGQSRRFDSPRQRKCKIFPPVGNKQDRESLRPKKGRKKVTQEPQAGKRKKNRGSSSRKNRTRMLKKLLEEVLYSSEDDFQDPFGDEGDEGNNEVTEGKENVKEVCPILE